MEAVREIWTDERMDDLNHRVDEGFGRMEREFQAIRLETRTEFAAVRGEMKAEFAAVRAEMKADFAAVRSDLGGQIAALNRTIVQVGAGAIVGFVGVIATLAIQS